MRVEERRGTSGGLGWWAEQFAGDLRQARRRLLGNPGFSVVAILILGTALGANTALFAFLNGYFLKPLPIRRAADHVELMARDVEGSLRTTWDLEAIDHLRAAGARVIGQVYGIGDRRAVTFVPGRREPVTALGAVVTDEYFAVLGPRLAKGTIPWLDPRGGDALPAVVLSDAG
jgi:hypothetical protein